MTEKPYLSGINWLDGMRVLREFPEKKPPVFTVYNSGDVENMKKLLEEWIAFSEVLVDNSIGKNLVDRTKKAIG